jgi:hypothetical protein
MPYEAFDPRTEIRDMIGYTRYIEGQDRSTVSVNNDVNDIVYVPLLMPDEVRGGIMPSMPFIEMTQITSPAETHNIGGDVRFMKSFIDLNIYYTKDRYITPHVFGKNISDEIVNKIVENRSSCSFMFMEIINDGREIIEDVDGKQIVFHKVVELYVEDIS